MKITEIFFWRFKGPKRLRLLDLGGHSEGTTTFSTTTTIRTMTGKKKNR